MNKKPGDILPVSSYGWSNKYDAMTYTFLSQNMMVTDGLVCTTLSQNMIVTDGLVCKMGGGSSSRDSYVIVSWLPTWALFSLRWSHDNNKYLIVVWKT